MQSSVFTQLFCGLGEVVKQFRGEQNVREDDLTAVLLEGRFNSRQGQLTLIRAIANSRSFREGNDLVNRGIIKFEEADSFVSASFRRIRHLHCELLHLEQWERTFQEHLGEIRLEL
jgi:hypothetical protein